MVVVSSREFRNHQARYLNLVDNRYQVLIQRGRNRSYRLIPVAEDDYITPIPPEYLCDPFDISPSGDMFWADKRNVENLEKTLEQVENEIKEGKYTVLSTEEDIDNFFNSL